MGNGNNQNGHSNGNGNGNHLNGSVNLNGNGNGHHNGNGVADLGGHDLLWDGLPPAVVNALEQPLDPALVSRRDGRVHLSIPLSFGCTPSPDPDLCPSCNSNLKVH